MFHFSDKISVIEFLPALKKFRKYMAIALVGVVTICALSSCHTSRRASTRPGHPDVADVHVGKASKLQKRIVEEAYTWLGTPYKYAGVEKGEGADCSGMVMKVYEKITGEKIPRNSAKQAEYCTRLDASDVDTGDLIFFATGKDPDKVSHVGIVIDNESFIHASSSKGVVVSKFTTPYYQRTFIMFGRVPHVRNLVTETR
jgi:lipoprotein Spr